MKEVTILINSCDKHKESWKILAYSFKKYWSDCKWDVLFMTNFLEAPMGKSTKSGKELNWTFMMKKAIKQINTPYILLTPDDFWLTSQISNKTIGQFIRVMRKNNVTHLRLMPATDGKTDYLRDPRLKVISKDSLYRTSLTTAIWNRNYLESFLKDGENPWQFETNGRYRERGKHLILATKQHHYHCLQQDNPDPKWHGECAIQQGKWFPGATKYAKEEGLHIDTSVHPKDVKMNIPVEEDIIEYINKQTNLSSKPQETLKFIRDENQVEQEVISSMVDDNLPVKLPPVKEIKVKAKITTIKKAIVPVISYKKPNAPKVLWLYQFISQYNYDHWFRIDFIKAIFDSEDVDVRAYGLGMDEAYPNISLKYNQNKLLSDIKKEFDFDIIISNTKSRMFERYVPPLLGKELLHNCILPKDFATWNKTPKISLEEDYHYEIDDSWYVENNIDLILQRHYSQFCRKENIKKLWFPFSVDAEVFKSDKRKRINKICNAGSTQGKVYPSRNKIVKILEPMGTLVDFDRKLVDNNYLECLKKYISHICCPSIYFITAAKILEISSSGSLLFTQESNKYGLNELFPKNCYFSYKEDLSDLKRKVFTILHDSDWVKETVNNALKCIQEKHTNEIRIKELKEIIKNEF